MSLESALDEERREVMALLEGRSDGSKTLKVETGYQPRATSPAGMQRSSVRSMLDVTSDAGPTEATLLPAPNSNGTTSPTSIRFTTNPVRSMLDTSSQPNARATAGLSSRRTSMPTFKVIPEELYQFDMLAHAGAQVVPKRASQGGKQSNTILRGALTSVFGSSKADAGNSRARHNSSSVPTAAARSISPSHPIGSSPAARSTSPCQGSLGNTGPDPAPVSNTYVTDSGKVIDMSNAYRRLSDAAMLQSGGKLAKLPSQKAEKGESLAPDGGIRLTKDYFADEEEEEVLESDTQTGASSDDEVSYSNEKHRGRHHTRKAHAQMRDSPLAASAMEERTPKSLLAAAEDERKAVSANHMAKTTARLNVVAVKPDTDKTLSKPIGIHPNTSFDIGSGSGPSTPMDSDAEADISDIRRAQRMALSMSPIHSTPESHRCVRQILRGEYDKLQKEAEMGLRRQRMYLVATDLSDEAAYALEWTIGTVLRDGDTLLAVYAVDEELGTSSEGVGVGIGEAAAIMNDTAKVVHTLSREQVEPSRVPNQRPSPLSSVNNVDGAAEQPNFDGMGKAEQERWHATQQVGDRCVKLLRKTRLQVRVVIEVFHCKSPKHMITEVIDYLEPTLVVLGSRGRSALKGVLLGSFSNYLVTKSSVPVMVARKRLRKHSKYKPTTVRLSNNLTSPRGKLELAKID